MSYRNGPNDPAGGGYLPAAPRVRFDAIGEAWRLMLSELGPWLIASGIVLGANWALTALVQGALGQKLPPAGGGFRVAVPPSGRWLVAILAAILNGVLLGGLFRMACVQVRGGRPRVGDLFEVTETLTEVGIASAVYALVVGVASVFLVLPSFVAAGVLMFTLPLVVDGRLTGVEALRQSWFALRREWLVATVFHLVAVLVTGLGFCLCGVGGMFTVPLYTLSIAVLYRDFFLAGPGAVKEKPAGIDPDFG